MSLSFASLITEHDVPMSALLGSLSGHVAAAAGVPPDERRLDLARLDALIESQAQALRTAGGSTRRARSEHDGHRGHAQQNDPDRNDGRRPVAALASAVHGVVRAEAPWRIHARLADVRPERVVREGRGHPITVAALAFAVGERAGLPVGLLVGERALLIALRGAPEAGAIEFGVGRVVAMDDLARHGQLRWACAHHLAGLVVDQIAARAEAIDLHPVHVAARELAVHLPVRERERQRREVELSRARSVWN